MRRFKGWRVPVFAFLGGGTLGALVVVTVFVAGPGDGEVPGACVEALDVAERAFDTAEKGLVAGFDAVDAASNPNPYRMDAASILLDVSNEVFEGEVDEYQDVAEDCRRAAR